MGRGKGFEDEEANWYGSLILENKENIERLEITGVGDPSGRGLGFSYLRVTPKAPISSAMLKKKTASAKVGSAVTGADADLRRLSMDAAREVLLKFDIPEEQIDKLTRWHRIALVRKLSSEQAASGVKVDAMTLSKFARGQRMSFLQLQQQTREKCQEIWDRQVQSLSAADGDEIDSDSEANSDLDSFAGDLENLLDAEEFEGEEEGNIVSKREKTDVVRGRKMRRCPSQAQTEEEVEDDEAEAALLRRMLDDDEAVVKKKKSTWKEIAHNSQLVSDNAYFSKKTNPVLRNNVATAHQDVSFTAKETKMHETKEIFKEKKLVERPARESFVCGACGQHGHMRTNKNCPKYGEDLENSVLSTLSAKSCHPDVGIQQLKAQGKKLIPKVSIKVPKAEVSESAKSGSKVIPLKFKCGSSDKINEKNLTNTQYSDKQSFVSAGAVSKPIKISKLIISNKMKAEDFQYETPKPSVVIRPPIDVEKDQSFKKIIIKQPKSTSNVGQVNEVLDLGMGYEFRKTKKITELSSIEIHKKAESHWFNEEDIRGKALYKRSLRDEEEKISKHRFAEERWMPEETMIEHLSFVETIGYGEALWREEKKTKKKKKKNKPDFRDDYLLDHKPYRNDRRLPEKDRASKRRPIIDSGQLDYAPPIKRRRGAEVMLSNILESIVDNLRDNREISFLFLKPVTKKEAPDYFHIVERPMDLSTIREKVRGMEYKSREEFRHDVWQITFNAHVYNDGRNPGIPPLADQLLELCDYHLQDKDYILTEAESANDRDV